MIDVPTNAKVECIDGAGGRCTGIVLECMPWQVTHFIVREADYPHSELMVSVDWVAASTPDRGTSR